MSYCLVCILVLIDHQALLCTRTPLMIKLAHIALKWAELLTEPPSSAVLCFPRNSMASLSAVTFISALYNSLDVLSSS